MNERLRSKTLRGVLWSITDRFAQQIVGFVVSVILARLLLPAEFGLMAMLTIFIAVSQVLIVGGLGEALIQKTDATFVDECSVFYFNIAVSVLLTGALFFSAPLIADFYDMPLLTPMTRVLSLSLIINAFGLIQVSLMIKRVDFRKQMAVSLISSLCAGVVGVAMALSGFGVWSLVWQATLGNLVRVALLWRVHGWRPAWRFSVASLRELWEFGSRLLFAGLIDNIFKNIYLMVIGKTFSATDLGLYARAQSIQQLPVQNIAVTSDLVSFPVFSSIQDDTARLKRGLRQGMMMQAVLTFPLMIGLACVARPLVQVLLTEKWLPSVSYLQLLCLAGLFYPLSVLNVTVLKARGRSDLFVRLEVVKRVLILVAIAVTYRWGITAMVGAQVVTAWIAFYLNSYYTARFIGYSFREQIADALPSLSLACLMGAGVTAVGFIGTPSPAVMLGLQVATGVGLYVLLCRASRLGPFMELLRAGEAQWAAFKRAEPLFAEKG